MKGPPSGKLGQVRSSQLISTFGPGSIVDLPDRDSYMAMGLDWWPQGERIDEPNLRSVLRVADLRAPATLSSRKDVPVRRFPIVHRCPNCSRLIRGSFCQRSKCSVAAAPARFIVACPNGHVDDFPWHWWAHSYVSAGVPTDEAAELVAEESGSETAIGDDCSEEDGAIVLDDRGASNSLAELLVKCLKCGRKRSLQGALKPGAFNDHKCSGLRFWLDDVQDGCDGAVRGAMRGASNVYFSLTASALSLPRHSSPVSILLKDHWVTLLAIPEQARPPVMEALLGPKGYSAVDGMAALKRYMQVVETEEELREEEYRALLGPHSTSDLGPPAPYFQARDGTAPAEFQPLISDVALVDRLREVRALYGFTRLSTKDFESSAGEDVASAAITRGRPTWLPAVENFGEGIFLKIDDRRLAAVVGADNGAKRALSIQRAYAMWRHQRDLPPSDDPPAAAFIALHSLAHLLIRQLALYCGYGMASIRERVYGSDDQAGILIYTAAADADGSLGGLVSFGAPHRLGAILSAAVSTADWCSQDPLCGDRSPEPGTHISGAACHACLLLPETSCEHGNRFLDRRLLRSADVSGLLDDL